MLPRKWCFSKVICCENLFNENICETKAKKPKKIVSVQDVLKQVQEFINDNFELKNNATLENQT